MHYFLQNTPPLEKPYHSSIPTHMCLSNRVLTLIFYYTLRDDQMFITTLPTCGDSQMKTLLSQLCRRFRYLILRNPTFWSAYHLTTGKVHKPRSLILLTRKAHATMSSTLHPGSHRGALPGLKGHHFSRMYRHCIRHRSPLP